ncbi:ribulose-phosphate 3-epimerase [Candidatus Jorgensenbacteria bacterium CG11_big_fil_rev_8_21_14_0_20_38_23]|uniref:Ribulose-phosphate 3-epimerase n=1 Tax=Candidatus Jorgensenbacteria bacterium CG11_big_fil_rev_8_21_14_0_20_38_23 TaxID=1974594 RepID=A0A2H0NH16_9BACT|nr:MAG: ribulose-phosphate 3-epimerase [Candidatus Jorgensenbacteria bacterium CG11_big_fil_rev_8_21_14_0_20_38_23]
MKTEIIPAINTDSFEELKRRIKLVEPFVNPVPPRREAGWVQFDIADGTFTKNTTWHNAEDLLSLKTFPNIEVHLMINNIEERIEEWLIAPVKRIIFHLEAAKNPDFVIEKCRKAGKEVGIAINPDTPWTKLVPYFQKADLFQVLGVYPGLAGQKFQEECFDKITHLRKQCKNCIIEVDGGMNKETAKKVVEAGADIIVAASAIFDSRDIKKAIEELKNV